MLACLPALSNSFGRFSSVALALSISFESGASLLVAAWERESPRCKGREKVPRVAGSNRRVWLCRWVSWTTRSACLFQPHTGKCRQGEFLALIVRKGPAYATTINSVFPEWNLTGRNCQNPGTKYFSLTPDTSCSFHWEKSTRLWFGVLVFCLAFF